jgi:predicted methyltransferase
MMRTWFIAALLATSPVLLAAKSGSDWLAIPGRADSDKALDSARKPIQVLGFLGLKKGDAALDYEAGGGYYTEIMARAVGAKGRVTAWLPSQFADDPRGKAKWASILPRNANVTTLVQSFEAFEAPANSYDFALLHLVYHDFYWESQQYKVPKSDPDAVIKRLYTAMKPGGIVGLVDHVGNKGDARVVVEATHRIDPAIAKADFLRAGFVLAGESPLLHVNGDDYAKNVFDPAVRGKTDRFVMKFVKPKK